MYIDTHTHTRALYTHRAMYRHAGSIITFLYPRRRQAERPMRCRLVGKVVVIVLCTSAAAIDDCIDCASTAIETSKRCVSLSACAKAREREIERAPPVV